MRVIVLLFDFLSVSLFIAFTLTQIVIPLLTGRPSFPIFRLKPSKSEKRVEAAKQRLQEAKDLMTAAEQEVQAAKLEAEAARLRQEAVETQIKAASDIGATNGATAKERDNGQ